ncbi:sodium/hydrogen exchanger family protein [Colletotrichum scovillei]|uniref:Sodium/hydrogen exchanger family protein n=1 Tax=Colletotrichum scovillei TaxID=1209932 RepID=A0A9P7QU14_9PEZI|nr:sodium/hydrogen exchanger family protein [Colletotrichum scovillei]KAF4780993.1 sodium/hydrogen exchanger family protein [Colletotrichum scovillei]KAG7039254.1 sodium/hydrogen exchanger family protein [Colletotrichum scovillei]KAG7041437.1 sodium/hydrogen exchanger family protein [Colletotrichum scovillei]KAG7061464.1 sodium/hydrogen exchanger family protein [Colletotrichum scovillei]
MDLSITNFNVVISVLGGWLVLFGTFSYLIKENLYLSEALVSLLGGVTFTHVAKLLKPGEYAVSEDAVASVTLDFSRLVLGVQLVLAGVQLPSRYLRTEWKSLCLLLGPGMIGMWTCTSAVVWLLVPGLPLVHALAIAACITPTDPVLSTTIVKGRFAEENVPEDLQQIIVAESGANDGLGYPFLFLALYLIKYTESDGNPASSEGGFGAALSLFFGQTCVYVVLMSVFYGWVVGLLAQRLLHWAERRKYVERECFLLFPIGMAIFILGTCGMVGSDDVLACFIAGNVFTWNDWFRLETVEDPVQPAVDMMLNMAIFMWLGAVCPWESFWNSELISPGRLVALGVLVLLLRRLPVILGLHRYIRQIRGPRQALFVGYFGPIGVSAIFYLYVGLEFLETLTDDDGQRADAKQLGETMLVTIWFLIICSIVIHGVSVPIAKLGKSTYDRLCPRSVSLPA